MQITNKSRLAEWVLHPSCTPGSPGEEEEEEEGGVTTMEDLTETEAGTDHGGVVTVRGRGMEGDMTGITTTGTERAGETGISEEDTGEEDTGDNIITVGHVVQGVCQYFV